MDTKHRRIFLRRDRCIDHVGPHNWLFQMFPSYFPWTHCHP